jgi:hypothetical protein
VRIAKLGSVEGYYLLYFDHDGTEMTDTRHESVERAMEQGEYEFGLSKSEWRWFGVSPAEGPG